MASAGTMAAVVAVAGLVLAAILWMRMGRLETRLDFLSNARSRTDGAFADVGNLLANTSTPATARSTLLLILVAHAEDDLGREFAKTMDGDESGSISGAMKDIHNVDPRAAQIGRLAVGTLLLTLNLIHQPDSVEVERA